jgi:hypothetical protein
VSRGLGAIQRTALRILRDGHWHTTTDLAAQIYGHRRCITVTATPTRSQMASALRALSGLVEVGLAYCSSGNFATLAAILRASSLLSSLVPRDVPAPPRNRNSRAFAR